MGTSVRARAARVHEGALVGARDDRIVDVTMIGSEAGEVVARPRLAMLAKLPYSIVRDAAIVHPTMGEGLGRSCRTCRYGPHKVYIVVRRQEPGHAICNLHPSVCFRR
jgi:hypothetical protein